MENKVLLFPTQKPPPSGTSFERISRPPADYISTPAAEGEVLHHRASSESFIVEQVSWLEELLNEPETPLYKGHRRSSSDSVVFLDTATDTCRKEETSLGHSWDIQTIDYHKNQWPACLSSNSTPFDKKARKTPLIPVRSSSSDEFVPSRDSITLQNSVPQEADGGLPTTNTAIKQNQEDSVVSSNANLSLWKADHKRAKQQFAQRSRVGKLQYIAQLERSVQILEAEGSQASANLEYLNRQFLILGMENQALKQRLDSLSQEQFAKYLEQDLLQKEIERLNFVYHQKQQLQQQHQWKRQQKQKRNGQQKYSKSREMEPNLTNIYM